MTAGVADVTGPMGWLAAAVLAAGVARCVTGVVGAVDPGAPGTSGRGRRWLEGTVVAGGLLLWWWEVIQRGQLPAGSGGDSSGLVVRFAAHVVLSGLLLAAAWIDLRHRVIPDLVTVPGVLVGLLWMAISPDSLLPVIRDVPRSFAAPQEVLDVLGVSGPLRGGDWSGGAAAAGLVAALVAFGGWWASCTAAFREPGPRGLAGLVGEPRHMVLVAGIAVVVVSWWTGADHWRGLASALAGLATAGAVVWLTRLGATRALGREAMGMGDVTLMAMVGCWIGWQAVLCGCMAGVFLGLAHGVVQLVRHRDAELPFGPSLCVGTALVVVGWRPIWSRVGSAFERPGEMAAVVLAVIGLTAICLAVWRRIRGPLD